MYVCLYTCGIICTTTPAVYCTYNINKITIRYTGPSVYLSIFPSVASLRTYYSDFHLDTYHVFTLHNNTRVLHKYVCFYVYFFVSRTRAKYNRVLTVVSARQTPFRMSLGRNGCGGSFICNLHGPRVLVCFLDRCRWACWVRLCNRWVPEVRFIQIYCIYACIVSINLQLYGLVWLYYIKLLTTWLIRYFCSLAKRFRNYRFTLIRCGETQVLCVA